jgi:uncharacterized membrane protein (UPF0127 family)
MNSTRLALALGLSTLLLAGCSRQPDTAPVQSPRQSSLPTQAQPRLASLKLYVGPAEIAAEIAQRPLEIMTGMMFRTNVTDADAMLFVLGRPQQASFWMSNCPEPLSCAYIDPEGIIQEIHAMEPFNTNSIVANSANILFVLETAHGWFDRQNVRTGMLVRTERGSLLETFFPVRTR